MLLTIFNYLLPFTIPGTSLLQDLIHLFVLCTLLYYAPQFHSLIKLRLDKIKNNQPIQRQVINPEVEQQAELQNNVAVPVQQPVNAENIENIEQPDGNVNNVQPIIQRAVGAKKAKSLAKKDQRRAHNEFIRAQSEAQKTQDEVTKVEREAVLELEKKRRNEVESQLRSQQLQDREEKRLKEIKTRQEDIRRKEIVLNILRDRLRERKWVNLQKVVENVNGWTSGVEGLERLIRAEGILGEERNFNGDITQITIMTEKKMVVRIHSNDMEKYFVRIQSQMSEKGLLDLNIAGKVLQDIVCL